MLQAEVTDKAPVLQDFKALGSMSPRVTVREGFDSVSPKHLFYKVVSGQEGSSRAFCDAVGLPEYASRLAAGWEDLSPGWKKREDKRDVRFRLFRDSWRSSPRSKR